MSDTPEQPIAPEPHPEPHVEIPVGAKVHIDDGVPKVKVQYEAQRDWVDIVWVWTRFALALSVTLGLFGMVVAFRSVAGDRDNLQRDLTCRSLSAVTVDARTAELLGKLGEGQAIIQTALTSIYDPNITVPSDLVDQSLENVYLTQEATAALVQAIADREKSIQSCSDEGTPITQPPTVPTTVPAPTTQKEP